MSTYSSEFLPHHRSFYQGFTIDYCKSITSSNDILFDLASNQRVNNKYIIVAESQTKGHGRYGRKWISEKGNLYFSLCLKTIGESSLSDENSIDKCSLLSFVTSIALSQTISGLTQTNAIILHKWPNDILLNNKKIAGILLKSVTRQNIVDYVIIGVGLNVASSPKGQNFIATNLYDEGIKKIALEEILKRFLDNFSKFYDIYINFGFEPIRNLWLEKAFAINNKICVNLMHQKITAKFKDLDNSGNLILEDDNGSVKIISSGEIFIE